MCHPGHESARIKGITGSDRPIWKWALGQLLGQSLEILRDFSHQKLKCVKKQVLQDPGYVESVEGSYCRLHGTLQEIPHVEGVKRNKKQTK